jgi:hypothetical protein
MRSLFFADVFLLMRSQEVVSACKSWWSAAAVATCCIIIAARRYFYCLTISSSTQWLQGRSWFTLRNCSIDLTPDAHTLSITSVPLEWTPNPGKIKSLYFPSKGNKSNFEKLRKPSHLNLTYFYRFDMLHSDCINAKAIRILQVWCSRGVSHLPKRAATGHCPRNAPMISRDWQLQFQLGPRKKHSHDLCSLTRGFIIKTRAQHRTK